VQVSWWVAREWLFPTCPMPASWESRIVYQQPRAAAMVQWTKILVTSSVLSQGELGTSLQNQDPWILELRFPGQLECTSPCCSGSTSLSSLRTCVPVSPVPVLNAFPNLLYGLFAFVVCSVPFLRDIVIGVEQKESERVTTHVMQSPCDSYQSCWGSTRTQC
jgi:hypothetical protein